jgi:hypothetical protein
MLRADKALFGPRSAHIAGLPYLFQALLKGLEVSAGEVWQEVGDQQKYVVARMSDGSLAALTMSDANPSFVERLIEWEGKGVDLTALSYKLESAYARLGALLPRQSLEKVTKSIEFGISKSDFTKPARPQDAQSEAEQREFEQVLADVSSVTKLRVETAHIQTCLIVAQAVEELVRSSHGELASLPLVAGGGGAEAIAHIVALKMHERSNLSFEERGKYILIPDHSVISAIGAALAVTCVSISRNCAQPSGGDIAELISEVERRLAAQGAERVATDYEYDPRRQVLTVTGRGSRPYEQDAQVRTPEEQQDIARSVLKADPDLQWSDDQTFLWIGSSTTEGAGPSARPEPGGAQGRPPSKRVPRASLACATDRFGRVLWQGRIYGLETAAPGRVQEALEQVVARHTQHTDGGAVMPQLGLLTGGRYIPLDQLGSAELIGEILRWEKLPADAQGCFVIGQ